MKINLFLTISAIALGVLLGYLMYLFAGENPDNIVCGVGSSLCLSLTLVPFMGASYQSSRIATNLRILSVVFFMVFLIINAVFINLTDKVPYYLIVNGIFIIIYLSVVYNLVNTKNI